MDCVFCFAIQNIAVRPSNGEGVDKPICGLREFQKTGFISFQSEGITVDCNTITVGTWLTTCL